MKIFYSPFHNFIHKVRVVAHEAGIEDDIDFVPTYPFFNCAGDMVKGQYDISELNPLAKVPFLALDDGTTLYSSQVVVEYLDSLSSGPRLYPDGGSRRFDALRRLSLGDSVFEFAVQMVMEGWREEQRADLYAWLWPKIVRAYDVAEVEAAGWRSFDIGHVGLLQGLSFVDSWAGGNDEIPENACLDWRSRWPGLAAWFDGCLDRPSVMSHYQKPFDGDDSPERFRAAVDEVLSARAAVR